MSSRPFTVPMLLFRRYANKLIPDKGLGLSAFDILTAEDGKVTWGNGLMYYKGRSALTKPHFNLLVSFVG